MNLLRALVILCALPTVGLCVFSAVAQAQDPYGQPPPQQGYQDPNYQQHHPPYPQQQGYGDPSQSQNYDDPNANQMQYGYFGPHPEPYEYGQQPCLVQGAHFHPYPPFDRYLFREANGYFYFVGDMGDFGYQGQQWGYQGNHPIPAAYGGGFCYIDWPHHHPFPPPPSMAFNMVGGFYAYAGPWDPAYWTYRAAWSAYFGGYYRNNYFGGRYWTVRPRPIYRPVISFGMRGVYRPGMNVYAPGGGHIVVTRGYAGGRYVGGAPVGGGHYVGGGAPVSGGHYVGGGAPVAGHYNAPVQQHYEATHAAPASHAEPMRSAVNHRR